MFNFFRKPTITLLDEKWNVVGENIKVKFIPRTHELMYLKNEGKYYRVANVIHNLTNRMDVFVVIELYSDDDKLMEKKNKK